MICKFCQNQAIYFIEIPMVNMESREVCEAMALCGQCRPSSEIIVEVISKLRINNNNKPPSILDAGPTLRQMLDHMFPDDKEKS